MLSMKTRRSFLSVLSVLVALPVLGLEPGCAGQSATVVLGEVEAGINDAEIAITTIETGVSTYFAVHPNPTLQAQINGAITDVETTLRAVNAALASATSLADGNVQAALAAFTTAYNALLALVRQIGIQAAPSSVTTSTRVNGVLYVPTPRLFLLVRPTPAAPAAKDKLNTVTK